MTSDPLHRAKSYPYPVPDHSYVLVGGHARPLTNDDRLPDLSGRQPVLACGSNRAPEQLARKFADPEAGAIPVMRARLEGFDIVYSAHFSSYGAIPATLQRAPETTVTLYITWLNAVQLSRMHETEVGHGNYDFGRLGNVKLNMDGGMRLDHAFAYVSCRGCLIRDGAPIALAAIGASGRSWPALDQIQAQEAARDRVAPGRPLDQFIADNIGDAALRSARTEALRATGQPFAYASFARMDV